MNLEAVQTAIEGRKWMNLPMAQKAAGWIIPLGNRRILELGHMHGASTCYFAAMAQDLCGHVTTCDLPAAATMTPNLEDGLAKCGLADLVTIHRDPEGAEWRMMQMIDAGAEFDFIYIDAGHSVKCCGLMFFLAERLLRPGGMILFDDIHWSYRKGGMADVPWVRRLTEAEQTTEQVGWVWRTLVQKHPGFEYFQEDGNWGWCWKRHTELEQPAMMLTGPTEDEMQIYLDGRLPQEAQEPPKQGP